jgi:hypothetical protein
MISDVFESPRDVAVDAQYIRVVSFRGSLVDEVRVGLPASVPLLLARKPLLRPPDDPPVDVVDFRHIAELHKTVGGQNLVRGRLAKPTEAAARDLECHEALIAVRDETLGFGADLGCHLFRALHVIKRQHIGICGGRGLFEAAVWHAQDRVHPFDHLAQRARV